MLICAWLGGEVFAASTGSTAITPRTLDVATLTHGTSLSESMIWCRTEPSVSLSELLSRGCDWQPLTLSDLLGRVDTGAYWMRIRLDNRSTVSVERWITLGHTRINHRTMFVYRDARWLRQDSGLDVPLDRRSDHFAAARGLFVVDLPAGQTVEIVALTISPRHEGYLSSICQPGKRLR